MILHTINVFRFLMPIRKHKITFISITQDQPTQDFKLLYDALMKEGCYDIHLNLIVYEHSLRSNILYLFNCIKQLYEINTSKLIIINDNNYVITKFKRPGTSVLQLWHACGAVKKFGNQIEREYPIQHYDYVVANAAYWKKPYQEAFGVRQDQVIVTGMPRLDRLCSPQQIQRYKRQFFQKYPNLTNKKIVLYAPTFRGNIIKGLRYEGLDLNALLDHIPQDYVVVYKLHPLLKDINMRSDERLINGFHESLYMLMCASDVLISDYSSILFDYALLDKKIISYAPDIESYNDTIGFNLDYRKQMPLGVCESEEQVYAMLQNLEEFDHQAIKKFRDLFMTHQDGKNTERVVKHIHTIMKTG